MSRGKKGAKFEREVAKQLSLWWSEGERDDIFWRTQNSGGRAKFRARQGVQTHGQCGDIQAVDPIGQPLLDLFTIELKSGYGSKRATIADVLDKPESVKKPEAWETFLAQVLQDQKNAGTLFYMLITKRDRREPLVFVPYAFMVNAHLLGGLPDCTFLLQKGKQVIGGTTLRNFLETFPPDFIRQMISGERKRVIRVRRVVP